MASKSSAKGSLRSNSLIPFSLGAAVGAAAAAGFHVIKRVLRSRSELAAEQQPAAKQELAAAYELKYAHPPHPTWTPKQPQPHPFPTNEMVQFDTAVVDKGSIYSLMISAVVPRPIGFISSMASDGTFNLAPYSYFNTMGHNPPIVAFGCCRHGGRPPVNGEPAKKDTLENIEQTGEFVVNIISDWYIEAANFTCGDFDRGSNEMELSGLHPVPSVKVRPPRVAESAVQFECKLRQVIDLVDKDGVPSQAVVLGDVVMVHVNKDATEISPTGKTVVDPLKLRPISRLGGVVYGRLGELFELPRPNKDGSMPAFVSKAAAAEKLPKTS